MKTEIKHELCTNLAHIEASKIVSAPKSLFAIISKSGKLHLWLDLNLFHGVPVNFHDADTMKYSA